MAVSPDTVRALKEALNDEYKARATYRAVIEAFGPVRPFVNIVESEGRHIEALLRLFERFDLEVPEDPWPGRVEAPASVAEACTQGVAAEIENEEMYARLLAATDEPEVTAVFNRLRAASQESHLPAFQRCLERETGSGAGGKGRGRGRRRGRQQSL